MQEQTIDAGMPNSRLCECGRTKRPGAPCCKICGRIKPHLLLKPSIECVDCGRVKYKTGHTCDRCGQDMCSNCYIRGGSSHCAAVFDVEGYRIKTPPKNWGREFNGGSSIKPIVRVVSA